MKHWSGLSRWRGNTALGMGKLRRGGHGFIPAGAGNTRSIARLAFHGSVLSPLAREPPRACGTLCLSVLSRWRGNTQLTALSDGVGRFIPAGAGTRTG
ncbi:hypothetical protein KCP78_14105 [Salmonella enterica subsp. enterica]|nr:hypothetical protein KCP78_14105 [Salmonella enterica subsp. enterica]